MGTTPHAAPSWIEGHARVVSVDGALARIVAERPSACGGCASKAACGADAGAAARAPRHGWQVPRVAAAGQAPLRPGDRLRVGVDRRALARATGVAYALPLAALVCAAVLARGAGDAWAAAAALAGLAGGAALAQRFLRHRQAALAPVVLGRLPAADAGCGAGPAGVPIDLQRSV